MKKERGEKMGRNIKHRVRRMEKINEESARRRNGLPRINRERAGRKQYIKVKKYK